MKIELIKSISISEYNERLYYEELKNSKNELSRRLFLKYLTIGSAGILIPSMPSKSYAVCPFPNPVCIAVEALILAWRAFKLYSKLNGTITLINPSKITKTDNIHFELSNPKYLASRAVAEYSVPPDGIHIYGYSDIDGSDKKGNFSLFAKNKTSEKSVHNIKFKS